MKLATKISSAVIALVCLLSITSESKCDVVSGSGTFANGSIVDDPMNNEVFSVISIAEAGLIEDISITITGLEHTNAGDLIAELRFLNQSTAEPAYLFFRSNVDTAGSLGSRANLDGNYTFTSNQVNGNPTGANFWSESALPDDETVNDGVEYFTGDTNGDFHDLSGPAFFGGENTVGDWQLVITDANPFGNNEGSVVGWTIEFDTVAIPEPTVPVVWVVAVLGFVNRRRYR
ncbi:MAG: hypothetical protein AAGA30_09560 [Planctomycetota bacterium]